MFRNEHDASFVALDNARGVNVVAQNGNGLSSISVGGLRKFVNHNIHGYLAFVRVLAVAVPETGVRHMYDDFRRIRLRCRDPGFADELAPLARWTLNASAAETYGGPAVELVGDASVSGAGLDCAGRADSFAAVPVTPCLNAIRDGLTLSLWVYPRSSAAGVLFSGLGVVIEQAAPLGVLVVRINPALGTTALAVGVPLNLTKWTLVTATLDSGSLSVYLNGVLVQRAGGFGVVRPVSVPSANVSIGRQFNGLIRDVRLYRTALTATAITTTLLPQVRMKARCGAGRGGS